MPIRLRYFLLFLAMLVTACGGGGGGSGTPEQPSQNTPFIFVGNDGSTGKELYKSDGSEQGTTLIKDIATAASSYASGFTELGDRLIFTAKNAAYGRELWVREANGSVHLLLDVDEGTTDSGIRILGVINGLLYFTTRVNDYQLWKTDGTAAGTSQFATLAGVSNIDSAKILNNKLILFTRTFGGGDSHDIWVSDGTTDGTGHLANLNTTYVTRTYHTIVKGTNMYFNRYSPQNGGELWWTDGTTITFVKSFDDGVSQSTIDNFVMLGNDFYFVTRLRDTPSQLWRSDGTTDGTVPVIADTGMSSGFYKADMTVYNDTIYVVANNDQLMRLVDSNLELVHDFDPAVSDGSTATISWLRTEQGKLYLAAKTPDLGEELWIANDTGTQVSLVKDMNPGTGSSSITSMVGFAGHVYFTNNFAGNTQLWKSDGTTPNTNELVETNAYNSHIGALAAGENGIYFNALRTDVGVEPWLSDGSPAGTQLMADIDLSNPGSDIRSIKRINGGAIFSAEDPQGGGNSLWITDGSDAGTNLISRFTSSSYASLNNIVANESIAYFSVSVGYPNYELWRTDYSNIGTVKVLESNNGGFYNLKLIGNKTYFRLKNDLDIWSPQVVGETDADSFALHDQEGVPITGPNEDFTALGNNTYFVTQDINTETLWRTDGSINGGINVYQFGDGKSVHFMTTLNDKLYLFVQNSLLDTVEIWQSGGTTETTNMVTSLDDAFGQYIGDYLSTDNAIYFEYKTELDGVELWVTNGTQAGTRLLKDINSGSSGSFPQNFTQLGDKIIFITYMGGRDSQELWITDGTESGTVSIMPTALLGTTERLTSFAVHENGLYFKVGSNRDGYDLWRTDGSIDGAHFISSIEKDISSFLSN